MKLNILISLLGTVILAACSGQQANLTETASSTSSQCSTDCLQVIFDEPIVGLNYSCGNVQAVTTVNGASCPSQSTISFYLQAGSGAYRVNVGTLYIDNYMLNAANQIRVTVKDIVSGSSSMTSMDNTAVSNTYQLLDALRSDSPSTPTYNDSRYVNGQPVNIIYIADSKKSGLDNLKSTYPGSTTVPSTIFTDTSYAQSLAPWFNSNGISLNPLTETNKRLEYVMQARNLGYFNTYDALDSYGLNTLSAAGNVNSVMMSIHTLNGRSGHSQGMGLHWTLPASAISRVIYFDAPFSKMRLTEGSNPGFNAYTNLVNGYNFLIGPLFEDLATIRNGSATGNSIAFNAGKLLREHVVIANAAQYTSYAGGTSPPANSLGTWIQTMQGSTQTNNGQYTLNKPLQLASYFDPEVWRTQKTASGGQYYYFPLHLVLTFNDSNGAVMGKQGVTVLPDGNIVSDGSPDALQVSNCAAVDESTLKDTTGVQETLVGFIRSASSTTYGSILGTSLLLNGDRFGNMDGILVANNQSTTGNVVGLELTASGQSVTANLLNRNASTGATSTVGWANPYYAYLTSYQSANSLSQTHPQYSAGTVYAQVASCNVAGLQG